MRDRKIRRHGMPWLKPVTHRLEVLATPEKTPILVSREPIRDLPCGAKNRSTQGPERVFHS